MVLDDIFGVKSSSDTNAGYKTPERVRSNKSNKSSDGSSRTNGDNIDTDTDDSLVSNLMLEEVDMQQYNITRTEISGDSCSEFSYFKQLIEGKNMVLKIDGENYLYPATTSKHTFAAKKRITLMVNLPTSPTKSL